MLYAQRKYKIDHTHCSVLKTRSSRQVQDHIWLPVLCKLYSMNINIAVDLSLCTHSMNKNDYFLS